MGVKRSLSALFLASCLCQVLLTPPDVLAQHKPFLLRSAGPEIFSSLVQRGGGVDSFLPCNPLRSSDIAVTMRVDKTLARAGDELTISAAADTNCHLTVLYLGSTGTVTVLWPNRDSNWDDRVSAARPVQIPSQGSSFKVKVDGAQPLERIVAYATSEPGMILEETSFSRVPDAYVKVYTGDSSQLRESFRRRIQGLPTHARWGTAQLAVRVACADRGTGGYPAEAGEDPPSTKALGILAVSHGKYLSVRDGKGFFDADKIGPTETFKLVFRDDEKITIVAQDGRALSATSTAAKGPSGDLLLDPVVGAVEFGGASSKLLGFRRIDGKYMAASPSGNHEIVFEDCLPDPILSRRGIFLLIPVQENQAGQKQWDVEQMLRSRGEAQTSSEERFIKK